MTIEDAKYRLRCDMRSKRLSLPDHAVKADAVAFAKRMIEWFKAEHIATDAGYLASYCAIQNELPQQDFLSAWQQRGGRICLPRMNDSRLVFYAAGPEVCYPQGRLGLPQPPPSCPEVLPDDITVMLIPGLAFDLEGYRIGFGGGYYDRFLSDLRSRSQSDLQAIGVGYDFQLVADVPHAQHDQPLDLVMTPNTTHRCI